MLRTTMICLAVDSSFNSHPVTVTEGDGAVDGIYVQDNGWVRVLYVGGNADVIPPHMIKVIREEWV